MGLLGKGLERHADDEGLEGHAKMRAQLPKLAGCHTARRCVAAVCVQHRGALGTRRQRRVGRV
jgi:hypothetical protein